MGCKKEENPHLLLRGLSMRTLNEKYPSTEWIRIYTDGLEFENNSGVGVFCDIFSR